MRSRVYGIGRLPPPMTQERRDEEAAIIALCDRRGVGYLARKLIREGASLPQARKEIGQVRRDDQAIAEAWDKVLGKMIARHKRGYTGR